MFIRCWLRIQLFWSRPTHRVRFHLIFGVSDGMKMEEIVHHDFGALGFPDPVMGLTLISEP